MASDPEGRRARPDAPTGAEGTGVEPGGVGRLRAVLAAARREAAGDAGPTPRELAEVLWLAGQLGPGPGDDAVPAAAGTAPAPTGPMPQPGEEATPATPVDTPREPGPHRPESPPDGRVPLHLPPHRRPGEAADGDGTPLLAPAPPMLHHPLALQRSLRPLKRKVPSPHARVLDEHATADRIARLGAHPDSWLPVLRPAPDRWLRLNLVHDTGPTMPVWRPLVRELHTVLAQSGIFRTVTLHPAGPDGRARQVPDPADGRTVTLVVSDCMGPQWRPGPDGDRWHRTLRRWSARMPVAVVQPLPEHLWHTTALPAEPGLLTPPSAAAPSAALGFAPYDPDAAPRPPSAVPLPVLEPAPSWLANWAALIGDPGGGRAPGAVAWLPPAPAPPAEAARDIAELDPEELVLRFRGTASPEAFRLAGHLSLAVPALPVMRLVQHALLRDPRPQHLAEIILSGMLTTVPGPPGSYAFRPGVRDLLHHSLPRTARGRTRAFLARVGGLIDERAGLAAGDFRAEARRRPSSGEDEAIATVSEETVRRLGGDARGGEGEPGRLVGGRYRLVGRRGQGQRVWEAEDTRTGRKVVVHRFPRQAAPRERFLRDAETLASLRDPHIVPVLDFGVDGETPYLVAAFVDGVTLTELDRGTGKLPFPVFARLACHVVDGLRTLHDHGLVRGQQGRDGLLLCPDGTVMLSRFALGDRPEVSDHEELGLLLLELALQVDAPRRYRQLLTFLVEGVLPEPALDTAAQLSAAGDPNPPTARDLDRLRFTLLGPLRISAHGRELTPPSPEAQALLAMLLLRHGRPVRNSELALGLWQDPPPADEAAARITGLSWELRRVLGPGVVATCLDGLALHVPDAFVDVLHCEDLLPARGQEPEPLTRRARRARIQQALDLYQGDPLDGVPGPAADTTRARLRALRLTLYASRAELDLELGDVDRAEAELALLVRAHPDHEELRRLYSLAVRRLGEPRASQAARPTIVFEADFLTARSRAELRDAVRRLLERGRLAPHQYELLTRTNGHVVLTEPGTDVHGVIAQALSALPLALAGLEPRPRVRATFWDTAWFADGGQPVEPPEMRAVLNRIEDDALVVSPALYDEYAAREAEDAASFVPLRTGPGTPPFAWYHPLDVPLQEEEPGRDLVRGPFPIRPTTSIHLSDQGRTAVVVVTSDGRLALLDEAPPRPLTQYYKVDLTTHRSAHTVSLPSSRGGAFVATVELSWHVRDPVAFVAAEASPVLDHLLDHVVREASRLTRRYPVRRAGAAQHAVRDGLRDWPVPGLSVACSVQLAPEDAVRSAPRGEITPADALRGRDGVLLGFDGLLTRLYSPTAARSAALELLRLVVEHRPPEDALSGRALSRTSAESMVHPLDVLRAFAADHRLGPLLWDRLDALELRAAARAPQPPEAASLLAALASSPLAHRFKVVTDVSEAAVRRHLGSRAVSDFVRDVHGRNRDPALLMPHPDCLRRALKSFRGPSLSPVMIGSSVAELDAARSLNMQFIGVARSDPEEDRLRSEGWGPVVRSLMPLTEALLSAN